MNARSLGLAAMAGAVIATGAVGSALAQHQLFDGYYRGDWECEQSGIGILRTQLTMFVRDDEIVMSLARRFDIDGRATKLSPDGALGIVYADGAFRMGMTSYSRDATIESSYTGRFSGASGTMTGTQVWKRVPAGRENVSRTCKGTFVKVEPPRKVFDGVYKGTLECEQSGIGIVRTELLVVVRDSNIFASASLFDIDGREKSQREAARDADGDFRLALEAAKGFVEADGAFRLADTVDTADATFHSAYTGTLSPTGGAMTGTHAWTRVPGGNSVSRSCKGTFVKVEPQ